MTRGTRAIVQGRLRQRSYETKEGEKRTVYELEADEVGVSLRSATAKVAKATRTGISLFHDKLTNTTRSNFFSWAIKAAGTRRKSTKYGSKRNRNLWAERFTCTSRPSNC